MLRGAVRDDRSRPTGDHRRGAEARHGDRALRSGAARRGQFLQSLGYEVQQEIGGDYLMVMA